MSKSDVGMEDAEKLRDDSGNNNIQESECKVVEAKDERVEEVPCSVAPSGDVNGSSNGGEDPKHRDKEKDETNEKTEVKDQSNPTNEASEPIEEGSAPKCRDEEKGDTNVKTEVKDQSSPVVAGEPIEGSEPKCRDEEKENRNEKTEEKGQISPVNEASEPIEGSDPKCRDEEKENRNEKTEVKYQINPVNVASESIEGSDPKCRDEEKDNTNEKTEVKDQTNPMNEVSEPKEGSDREIITTQNENKEVIKTETETEAQTAASSAVEQQSDEKNEVVEHEATNSVAKEDDSTNNDLMDVERPNNDIMEKKPKQIGDDTDNTAHVLGQAVMDNVDSVPAETLQLPELSANKDPQAQDAELNNVQPHGDEEMEDAVHSDQNKMVIDQEKVAETLIVSNETVGNDKTSETAVKHDIKEPSAGGNDKTFKTAVKPDTEESSVANQQEAATPNSLIRCSTLKNADHSGETAAVAFTQSTLPSMGEDDDGTPEEQAAFMKELEQFYRERSMDFKPPRFYGHPLNCLKLWRATIKLGGYDRVTGSKLWRQVGESFHPPKTCTTVSWTFRIFYEKSLLEYERYKTQSGELRLPIPILPEVSGGDIEGNGYQGSGRPRKDSAARATQGRNAQRVIGAGEIGDPIIKDKNPNDTAHNEKNLKSIGSLKQKRPNEVEHSNKAARTDVSKQLVTSVVDVGSPADWVKINVRQTKECFEVYALVPGLLREEVRVQSDPAGRLVITGQPEQLDNPWGITPFKKVISLPARIDPFQTSAVVSLHGRLLVRVPFEQTTI